MLRKYENKPNSLYQCIFQSTYNDDHIHQYKHYNLCNDEYNGFDILHILGTFYHIIKKFI